jgi:enoyl-CoA hydratase
MDAAEAERCGLVSRVVPVGSLVEEALKTAGEIASYSQPVVAMAKECVNRAYESSLAEGILFERRMAYATFATEDRKEGMAAFAQKRKPQFRDR